MATPQDMTIPPIMPHQVRALDGLSLDGSVEAMTVTAVKDGVNPKLFTLTAGSANVLTTWQFGDGSPAETTAGNTVSHVYAAAATYQVFASQPSAYRQGHVGATPTAARRGAATVTVEE
jgi:hypothetical protein